MRTKPVDLAPTKELEISEFEEVDETEDIKVIRQNKKL